MTTLSVQYQSERNRQTAECGTRHCPNRAEPDRLCRCRRTRRRRTCLHALPSRRRRRGAGHRQDLPVPARPDHAVMALIPAWRRPHSLQVQDPGTAEAAVLLLAEAVAWLRCRNPERVPTGPACRRGDTNGSGNSHARFRARQGSCWVPLMRSRRRRRPSARACGWLLRTYGPRERISRICRSTARPGRSAGCTP